MSVECLLGEMMTQKLGKEPPIAFVPIGGMGKRLRPIAVGYSKALVRIVNRPLVDIVVATLASEVGVRRFIFGVKGLKNYQTLWDYFKGKRLFCRIRSFEGVHRISTERGRCRQRRLSQN